MSILIILVVLAGIGFVVFGNSKTVTGAVKKTLDVNNDSVVDKKDLVAAAVNVQKAATVATEQVKEVATVATKKARKTTKKIQENVKKATKTRKPRKSKN